MLWICGIGSCFGPKPLGAAPIRSPDLHYIPALHAQHPIDHVAGQSGLGFHLCRRGLRYAAANGGDRLRLDGLGDVELQDDAGRGLADLDDPSKGFADQFGYGTSARAV